MSRFALAFPMIVLAACSAEAPVEIHRFTSGPEGFDTHSYWVDTGAEVVVFDAQFTPELASALLAEIQAATEHPVRYVVVSSPNPDKFNGAAVFQAAGASLVASEATEAALADVWAYKKAYFVGAGMFTEDTWPALPSVDLRFQDTLSLELDGGVDIGLVVLDNPAVSTTATVAVIDGADLIVGDLGFYGAHAWLEGGIVDGAPVPDLAGWQAAFGELPALGDGDVYPGRGEVAPVGEGVQDGQAYLGAMETLVADYLAGLDDPMAALTGEEAGAHYAAITAEAEAAWPERDLSYLITYGVYGLALQIAAE